MDRSSFFGIPVQVSVRSFGARRFWFAFTALSAFSVCRQLWFSFRNNSRTLEEESGVELDVSVTNLAPGMTAASVVAEESSDLVYSCRCDIKLVLYFC